MAPDRGSAGCSCQVNFGEGKVHAKVATSSQLYTCSEPLVGRLKRLQSKMPQWSFKGMRIICNRYHLKKGHGVDRHNDKAATYSNINPIVGFSMGSGAFFGIHTLVAHSSKKKGESLYFWQSSGDVLLMCGQFQEHLFHSVPSRTTWAELDNALSVGRSSLRFARGRRPLMTVCATTLR